MTWSLSARLAAVAIVLATSCDTVHPEHVGTLVAELYVEPHRPPPPLRLTRTTAFGTRPPAVSGAEAEFVLDGRTIAYTESERPGTYVAATAGAPVDPGSPFVLRVRVGGASLEVAGVVPPPIRERGIAIDVPARAVRAVLLDSLSLPLDSLQLPTQTGYLYPIVVTLSWRAPGPDDHSDWWMQTRLAPVRPFTSTLIDYFLRPEGLVLERADGGLLAWSGVYAVPVPGPDDPLPPHDLRVAMIRGSLAWADFASSAGDPDRREPVSNVGGGLGLVVGIAVDTLRVTVR